MRNNVPEYAHDMDKEKRQEYEAEVERSIDEGILIPWRGEVKGVIPLMAVEQPTKNKIRTVLDFRELNESVKCHTGDDATDVCSEKLREWRKLEGDGDMVDLKAAYLQIKVAESVAVPVGALQGHNLLFGQIGIWFEFGTCQRC